MRSMHKRSAAPGRILHTLVGYVEQPTLMQLITYVATAGIIVSLSRLTASPRTTLQVAGQ
jgi:high-affinity iron transporter